MTINIIEFPSNPVVLDQLSAEAFAETREETSCPAAAEIVVAATNPASAGSLAAATAAIRSSRFNFRGK